RTVMFTDSRVNSFSYVEDSVLLPGVDVGRHARLKRCVVGSGTQIPEGLVVGEDPAEDARRYYRSEGGITLITRDMI
ncbi:MAG: glucose-1-phosphate adenylyltransferase, partial [Rhodospirillaceae bacterium]